MGFVAVAGIFGILLDWACRPPASLLVAACFGVAAVWVFGRSGARGSNLCLLALLVGAGALRAELDLCKSFRFPVSPVAGTWEGSLTGDPALGRSGRVITAWFRLEPGGPRVQVRLPARAGRFEYGERLRVRGSLREGRAAEPENPNRFGERRWLWVHGAAGVLSVSDPESVVRLGMENGFWPGYRRWVGKLRRVMAQESRRALAPAESGMLEALLLGEGRGIPRQTWDVFRKTGTVHVLVVSGMHVGLIAGIGLLFFALLGTPRVARYLLLSGVLLTYCLLTGLQPPIVRSTVGGLLVCWAKIRGIGISPPNLLGAAAAVMLALEPRALGDASFQLSFAAVAGLLLAGCWRSKNGLLRALAASCGAWLATAPLVAWHFRTFAFLAPLVNLIVVPASSLLIAIGFLVCGSGLLVPWAAGPFAAAFAVTARALTGIVTWMAGLPGAGWTW